MKRILLYFCCLLLIPTAFAQHKDGIGLSFGANDFYGPQTGNYFTDKVYTVSKNLDNGNEDTTSKNTFRWHPLVKFSYWHSLNKYIDLSVALSIGNVDYPASSKDTDYINRRKYGATKFVQLLAELDARVNYNILPKSEYIVSPYLFAGISGSHHPVYFGVTIPLGAGINFNLAKSHDLYLNLESAYKITATDHDFNHLQHTVGFIYWFKPGYHKMVEAPAPEVIIPKIIDSDGDGIPDDQDQCPTIAGTAQFNGCPDSDGDGISDKDDACPLVAGLSQFQGCPDTDGDGIPDNTDKCPYVAGTSQYGGCPPPDRDHDGVLDDVDRCPDVAGPASNQGCPEIRQEIITQVEKAAKAIFFESGKATIKKVSFKSLDAVVSILKADPGLYADVEGHTDNMKPKTYTNTELSQKRAEAVRDYFAAKGIAASRMTAQGFGDTQPIADNKTVPGRAQNRRTVIKLRNFAK